MFLQGSGNNFLLLVSSDPSPRLRALLCSEIICEEVLELSSF